MLTTGRASWEAAVGRAGGPRPWSTTERPGTASGTGEGLAGQLGVGVRAGAHGRVDPRLFLPGRTSACHSRFPVTFSLYENTPPHTY